MARYYREHTDSTPAMSLNRPPPPPCFSSQNAPVARASYLTGRGVRRWFRISSLVWVLTSQLPGNDTQPPARTGRVDQKSNLRSAEAI